VAGHHATERADIRRAELGAIAEKLRRYDGDPLGQPAPPLSREGKGDEQRRPHQQAAFLVLPSALTVRSVLLPADRPDGR